MIDKNRTYKTRDGREVRIYATDCGIGEPIHGAIKTGSDWEIAVWNSDGSYCSNATSVVDLIEVRPRIKRTVWLNVYRHGVTGHNTEDIAERHQNQGFGQRLACVQVEIDCEEGDGL